MDPPLREGRLFDRSELILGTYDQIQEKHYSFNSFQQGASVSFLSEEEIFNGKLKELYSINYFSRALLWASLVKRKYSTGTSKGALLIAFGEGTIRSSLPVDPPLGMLKE